MKNRAAGVVVGVPASVRVASLIGIAAMLNSGVALLYQILLARVLNPDEFGALVSILALVTTLATLSGFGISHLWLKAFTENFAEAKRLLFGSYLVVATAATISTASLAIASVYVEHLVANSQVTAFISLMIFSQCFMELLIARYQVERRERSVAVALTIQNLLRIIIFCLVWLIQKNIDIYDVALAHAISSAIILAISIFGLKSFSLNGCWLELPSSFEDQARDLKKTAKAAAPFGTAALFQILYYQSDLIMLPIFSSNEEAGLYAAAFVLTAATFVLPNAIIQRFFMTRVHLWSSTDLGNLKRFAKLGVLCFGAVGLVSAIILTMFSAQLLGLIFGPEYIEAAEIQAVLAASIPMIFASYVLGSIITTQGFMLRKTKILGLVSFFNIFTNVWMIPTFGALGAAWTTLASSILIFILYSITTSAIFKEIGCNE